MTSVDSVGYVDTEREKLEQALAEFTVAMLREAEISDEKILSDFTVPHDIADYKHEQRILKTEGVRVSAARIKLLMRQLVTN